MRRHLCCQTVFYDSSGLRGTVYFWLRRLCCPNKEGRGDLDSMSFGKLFLKHTLSSVFSVCDYEQGYGINVSLECPDRQNFLCISPPDLLAPEDQVNGRSKRETLLVLKYTNS